MNFFSIFSFPSLQAQPVVSAKGERSVSPVLTVGYTAPLARAIDSPLWLMVTSVKLQDA